MCTYVFLGNNQSCSNFELTSNNINTKNDRSLSIKNCIFNYFKHTRENSVCSTCIFSFILTLLHVQSELIKQVIYDFCRENFNSFLFGKLCCFSCDSNIKCKNRGKLLFPIFFIEGQNLHSFHYILFVNRADRDITYRYF